MASPEYTATSGTLPAVASVSVQRPAATVPVHDPPPPDTVTVPVGDGPLLVVSVTENETSKPTPAVTESGACKVTADGRLVTWVGALPVDRANTDPTAGSKVAVTTQFPAGTPVAVTCANPVTSTGAVSGEKPGLSAVNRTARLITAS